MQKDLRSGPQDVDEEHHEMDKFKLCAIHKRSCRSCLLERRKDGSFQIKQPPNDNDA